MKNRFHITTRHLLPVFLMMLLIIPALSAEARKTRPGNDPDDPCLELSMTHDLSETATITCSVDAGPDQTISCPGDMVTLTATATGSGSLIYDWYDGSGGYIGGSASVTDYPFFTTTYTVTVYDSAGCSASDDVTVTVSDTVSPTFSGCPGTITAYASATECEASVSWTEPSPTDNCGIESTYQSHYPGDIFPVGTTSVTYEASDMAGNYGYCFFDVVVYDTVAPTFSSCPATITVEIIFGGDCDTMIYWTEPMAEDNCNVSSVTQTHYPGDIFQIGTTTVTYVATDDYGNTGICTFDVIVEDNTPPVLDCPILIYKLNEADTCGAHVSWTTMVSDNCGTPTVVCTPASGTYFEVGTTGVTCIADDGNGNMVSCTFDVIVADTTKPKIMNCPANITMPADSGKCEATVTWTAPTATDNCPGVTLTASKNPGAVFMVGVTTVLYTAIDAAGNFKTCTFTVTIEDKEDPKIQNCPGNVFFPNKPGDCEGFAFWQVPTQTDNCPGSFIIGTHAPFAFFPVGTTEVTYTAWDASGNTAECKFDVVIGDVEAPTLSHCPPSVVLYASSSDCEQVHGWVQPIVTDNCPLPFLVSSHLPGDTFAIGTTLVNLTGFDFSGNNVTCLFTVTVNDTIPPVISGCPQGFSVSTDSGLCTAVVSWASPLATDNCGIESESCTPASGSAFPLGNTLVNCVAVDSSGNADSCAFVVHVYDNIAPYLGPCPSDISVNTATDSCAAQVFWTPPGVSDNCPGVNAAASHFPGDWFSPGTTLVHYTASDPAGNTAVCDFYITVSDSVPPVLVCPADTFIDATQTCYAIVNWASPMISDNCELDTIFSNHQPGDTFYIGVWPVTYIAIDTAGNVDSCTFTITVADTEPPVLSSCPPDVSVATDPGVCTASVFWVLPTISDNCPCLTYSASHTPGDAFPLGTTTVLITVTDQGGNADSCSFTVTVEDLEPPAFAGCPANITQGTDPLLCSAIVFWAAPTATDNCSGVTVVSSHNPGDVFSLGTETVVYTATDVAGNTATCQFTVTVNDTEDPEFLGCPANIILNADPGKCDRAVNWIPPVAIDNCPGVPVVFNTDNPGDRFPVGTTPVIYAAQDASGNWGVCTFDVTIVDNQNPVINNCPGNIVMPTAPGLCGNFVNWVAPTAVDNCPGVVLASTHVPGQFFNKGNTLVSYTATDASGNIALCIFTVTVVDLELPILLGCPGNIVVPNIPGLCENVVNWVPPVPIDNCPGVMMNATHAPGMLFPVGTTTVTYTAIDAVGNWRACAFNVTVQDVEFPVMFGCPGNQFVFSDSAQCGAPVSWSEPVALDNCPGLFWFRSHLPGNIFPPGTTSVTYAVTDLGNNTVGCTFDVTVLDTFPPVALCPPDVTQPRDSGQMSAIILNIQPTVSSDTCPVAISYSTTGATVLSGTGDASGQAFNIGVTEVLYQLTDSAGNSDTCSFTVTVTDTVYCGKDSFEPNDVQSAAANLFGGAFGGAGNMRLCPAGDEDWYYVHAAKNGMTIRAVLDGLPADYNLELHNGSGMLASSANTGTSQESINYPGAAAGNYFIRVYGQDSAWNAASSYSLSLSAMLPAPIGGTGIKPPLHAPIFKADSEPQLRVYPNPAEGDLNVEITAIQTGNYEIRLLDLPGRLLRELKGETDAGVRIVQLDLGDIPEGTYLLEVRLGEFKWTEKIVRLR